MSKVKVEIRKREPQNGKSYLYLEYSPALYNPLTGKETRKEALKRYIFVEPKTEEDKEYNVAVWKYARKIRNLRMKAIVNKELKIFDDCRLDEDFLEYYQERIKLKNPSWQHSYEHLKIFVKGKCKFRDIKYRFAELYKDYLLNRAAMLGPVGKKARTRLHQNTAKRYFEHFKSIVKDAYIEGYLKDNISDHFKRIPQRRSQREFLTQEEVKKLLSTPCEYDVLRNLIALAIFSGLRPADIKTLDWSEILLGADGEPIIRKQMHKTKNIETIPISRDALKFCGIPKSHGLVFNDFRPSMAVKPLRDWVKAAGITKHVTLYTFRHTCATMLITAGADINTVSRHMTHASILTTQQYFHQVDNKAREAANLIKLD
jgi:integrase